jgi:hypothetical protein
MVNDERKLTKASGRAEIDAFLRRMAHTPARSRDGRCGRLLFALDATASREPTWDRACQIQGDMFDAAAGLGGIEIQLAFYRGFGEFQASPWLSRSTDLIRTMTGVACRGGHTQIARILRHALAENARQRVDAVVFVGDCMEENPDVVCQAAGELGLVRVPVFAFQEGTDHVASATFREIARLSGGAHCAFDLQSADQLRDLLRAVAAYAAGGIRALRDAARSSGPDVLRIARQMK